MTSAEYRRGGGSHAPNNHNRASSRRRPTALFGALLGPRTRWSFEPFCPGPDPRPRGARPWHLAARAFNTRIGLGAPKQAFFFSPIRRHAHAKADSKTPYGSPRAETADRSHVRHACVGRAAFKSLPELSPKHLNLRLAAPTHPRGFQPSRAVHGS
jgi:hypothetical protein